MSGTKLLTRAATFVLGVEDAGACIPEYNQVCACWYTYSYCWSPGVRHDVYENYRYNCTGSCLYAGGTCKEVAVADSRCH